MKLRGTGTLALVVVTVLAAAGSAFAGTLSARLEFAMQALEAWQASGGEKELAMTGFMPESMRNLPVPGASAAVGMEPELRLLVVTDQPDLLRNEPGITVGTVAGPVVTVTAVASRVRDMASMPGVRRVEFSKPLQPLLDVSVPEINADQVHGGSAPPYDGVTGAGVVIGLVDTGIDYTHPDFDNGSGTSRITRIWDQLDAAGPNPSGYNYGSEWTTGSINAGTAREKDYNGHGTHVAGIAAGNGASSSYTYVGTAPEAEIIFVKTTFDEADIIDGVNWIQNHAGAKPCVVNLSLGSQTGPHDGTYSLDVALSALSGPGRIVVAAAGNHRGSQVHAEAVITGSGGSRELQLVVNPYSPSTGPGNDRLYTDAWYTANLNFSITVTSPNGHTVGPVGPNNFQMSNSPDGTIQVTQQNGSNGDRSAFVDILDSDGTYPPASGTWKINFQNNSIGDGELDQWIVYNELGSVFWNNFVDDEELITTPATADSVLAVAAYTSRDRWPLYGGGQGSYSPLPTIGLYSPFSSKGPRRDGGLKPDISAPGMGIGSTLSSDALNPTFTQQFARLPTNIHCISQGTSQSSPHVAGTVALMLQMVPTASYSDIRSKIIESARSDSYTGPAGFTIDYGYGKLDAQQAVALIVPVRLLSIAAAWEDGSPVIRWTLSENEPGARFVVERAPRVEGPYVPVSLWLEGELSFAWTDPAPDASEPWYRVNVLTRDGGTERFGPVSLDPLLGQLRVWQNAPNPFSATTVIAFELDRPQPVSMDVIDVRGRLVRSMDLGRQSEGRHEIEWDGTDEGGRQVAAGIYFYRIRASESVFVRRMVLTR